MGAMAPYFSLLPVPAGGVPTNAAVIATQHYDWRVRVLDDGREIPIVIESMRQFDAGPGYVLVRPVDAWPAHKTLELVATTTAIRSQEPTRQIFRTAAGPLKQPPACAWQGPIGPSPRGPSMPAEMWPTNMPYRPHQSARGFVMPLVQSDCGYLVAVRLWLEDAGETFVYEGSLAPGPSVVITLPPQRGAISDAARIVALEITDMAGNVARVGTVPNDRA